MGLTLAGGHGTVPGGILRGKETSTFLCPPPTQPPTGFGSISCSLSLALSHSHANDRPSCHWGDKWIIRGPLWQEKGICSIAPPPQNQRSITTPPEGRLASLQIYHNSHRYYARTRSTHTAGRPPLNYIRQEISWKCSLIKSENLWINYSKPDVWARPLGPLSQSRHPSLLVSKLIYLYSAVT